MPSRIIHYCVAEEIMKKANLNKELFLLGNLAPDAYPNLLNSKSISHFRIPKEKRVSDYIDINSFKNKYMFDDSDDLILGYYCHLITDNLWLMTMYKKYIKSQFPEHKAIRDAKCYRDYDILNSILINHFNLKFIDFKIPINIKIDEIDIPSLKNVITSLKSDFISPSSSEEYLSLLNLNSVLDFISIASDASLNSFSNIIK